MTELIYGFNQQHENLTVQPADAARGRAAEQAALKGCSTRREAVALAATLRWMTVSFEDWEWDESELDAPFDWTEDVPGAGDGDWPPMPDQDALDTLASEPWFDELFEIEGVEEIDTTLNGPYLHIPVEREPELLALLKEHGVTVTRDDAVVEALL